MNDWQIWFGMGMEHILDRSGYDHILFVILLVFTYPLYEWKKLLLLITAFTLGHSTALALSTFDILKLPQNITELMIILTIVITALFQLFSSKNTVKGGSIIYFIICCFGWIHGAGFSYLLKNMLGKEESILKPLLMFNLGLEAGQIVIVGFVVLALLLIGKYAKAIERPFKTGIISVILAIALYLCYSRILNILQ
jgi:hypothetical protein